MALLLSIVANLQPRSPYYTPRITVEWDRFWAQNLMQTTLAPASQPFSLLRNFDWPVPFGPFQFNRGFTASYNVNLIGQDLLPSGKQITDLSPRPYEYRSQAIHWTSSYNLNLIGKDVLPRGKQSTELTARPAEAYPYRSWTASYNVNLIGQDQLPFRQLDWPLPNRGPAPIEQTITVSFNKNLIGQDALPVGKDVLDLPPRDYDRSIQLRTWINVTNPAFYPVQLPKNQYDWPVPQDYQRPISILAVSFNPNLTGKDQLPPGARLYDLPPSDFQRSIQLRTWIGPPTQSAVPFRQTDWPLTPAPRPIEQTLAVAYNRNLIGQDQ